MCLIKYLREREKKIKTLEYLPLNAIPEVATTQVWMTVFSCRVKGCLRTPDFSRSLVHVLMKKKPKSPAETLREGIIPVVRLNFNTMKVKRIPNMKLTQKALKVNWSCHDGTSLDSKILSTEYKASSFWAVSSSPSFFFVFLFTLSDLLLSIASPKQNKGFSCIVELIKKYLTAAGVSSSLFMLKNLIRNRRLYLGYDLSLSDGFRFERFVG